MKNTKINTQQAVISSAIKFTTEADVKAYMQLSPEAVPENDMIFEGVAKFTVGYKSIILFNKDGRRIIAWPREKARGMAVGGSPVILHGPDFQRIGLDDEKPEEQLPEDETSETDAE